MSDNNNIPWQVDPTGERGYRTRLPDERRPDWAARPAERLPRVFATRDDAWECYERMSDEKKDAAWSRGWR